MQKPTLYRKLPCTALCLLMAWLAAGLCAQTGSMVGDGILKTSYHGTRTTTYRQPGGYNFGQHIDTVLSTDDMAGIAAQQFTGAIFFHPVFQKIGKHYGLLTVFVKYPDKASEAKGSKRPLEGQATSYLRDHQKYMTAPTVLNGYGATFFRPFTKELGRGYAMLSVYIKYDDDDGEPKEPDATKAPFLQLHGNIAYTFDYRSRLDTPFAAVNLQLHNEQVYADAVFKGRYPFRVVLNSRQSNSLYFKDYTDVALQFDRNAFRQKLRQELADSLARKLRISESPARYDALARQQQQKWAVLKNWLESPARRQEAVQEREQAYREVASLEGKQQQLENYVKGLPEKQRRDSLEKAALMAGLSAVQKKLAAEKQQLASMSDSAKKKQDVVDSCSRWDRMAAKKDTVSKLADSALSLASKYNKLDSFSRQPKTTGHALEDSMAARLSREKDSALARLKLPTETEKKVRAKQKELDSLYKKIIVLQKAADSLKNDAGSKLSGYTSQLAQARSAGELDALAKKAGTGISGADKNLLSLTQFNIGRSNISYSDLTVNNISLSGLNIEYNPSYYAAFAVGSVDYLFRDFETNPGNLPKQDLLLGRFGWGDKDKQVFILTAYTGTKNSFNGPTDTTLGQPVRLNTTNIFGYSLETRYRVDQNTILSFEAAKSSAPYTNGLDRSKAMGRAFAFSDRNNEAWSAKLDMAVPSTQSTFNAFYKQVGASFQSYSIFSSGTRQESWGIKWRQVLWKKQLTVTAQVRKNGFENPLVANTYNSSIVFKSLQATLRVNKWPVLSVGYMPSSQLTKAPDGSFSQNIYYTFTSNAFYGYKLGNKQVSSNLLYTRFYNKGTDTGFVRYDATDILFTQNMNFGKLRSTSGVQYTGQPRLRYWTLEQQFDMQFGKLFTVGAGAKTYRLDNGLSYWGGLATASLQLKKQGGLRLQYDKGYLPNGLGSLVPNDWGRLTWFKIF